MGIKECDDIMTANCSHWDGVGQIAAVMLAINVSGFQLVYGQIMTKCLKKWKHKVNAAVVGFMTKHALTCPNILQVACSGATVHMDIFGRSTRQNRQFS